MKTTAGAIALSSAKVGVCSGATATFDAVLSPSLLCTFKPKVQIFEPAQNKIFNRHIYK